MPGVDVNSIQETPCPFCRQKVSVFEGTFSEGRWYHEKCATYKTGEQIEKLEKKAKRGSITLEEAEELKDLKILYANLRRPEDTEEARSHTRWVGLIKESESPKSVKELKESSKPLHFFGNTKIARLSLEPKEDHKKSLVKPTDKPLLTEAINSE